jgi:two-component system CheB/CheR fusion protein
MVIFAYHNVFKDPPFRKIDLVSCRNLLIYLQPVLQKRIISNFQFSLNAGGFLFLGTSESLGDLSTAFYSADPRWKLFRHKGGSKPKTVHLSEDSIQIRTGRGRHAEHATATATTPAPQKRMDVAFERLIEATLAPCVIIDGDWRIMHIFGDVSDFLHVPAGRLDFSLNRMVRPDLSIAITSAVQQAVQDQEEVAYSGLRVSREEDVFDASIGVKPILNSSGDLLFAILLRREQIPEGGEEGDADGARGAADSRVTYLNVEEGVQKRMNALESELQYTKENLQATIEELETSNEELQATNEELLSSNEELQSTNEELQSVNEELITVNAEYQKKIEELSQLNSDMNNLLSSTDIGTVFLDENLVIRKFTPAVTKQINLIDGDIGRPFFDISNNLLYENLQEDIHGVLQECEPREAEVRSRLDNWYLVKIQPYRTAEGCTEGVVVTLVDITDRKLAEEQASRQHDLTMRILQSNPTAITMVDAEGHIVFANERAEELLGLERSALTDMTYDDPQFRITDTEGTPIPSEELPFQQIRRTGESVTDYVHRIEGPDGRIRSLQINGSPIYTADGAVDGAVFNLRELT